MTVHASGTQHAGHSTAALDDPAEGPLAHAARVASEEAYLDGLGDMQRTAWERASGARPEEASKRLLVDLSHTIEKAVMSGPLEDPTVVVALFQRLPFFDREREVYERMADAGVHIVVAFVEGEDHEPPRGITTVLLDPEEPLAEEWSIVALGPRAGAFLVATDQHRFDASEREYEASRQFLGRWGYARTTAASELARLRFALGDRIDGQVRRTIDGLLAETMPAGGQAAASAGTPGETWATTSLYHMIARMHSATSGTRELREQLSDSQQAAAARSAASVDPQSGLTNPDFLQRWAQPAGGTTALPIGIALFDVAAMDDPAVRDDHRAGYHAARQVAAALTLPLGPVDAVVRLSSREFLVVVPGASPRHLSALCDEIGEQLELVSGGYPGVSLRAVLAMMCTRQRPLPVETLQNAMGRLRDGGGAGPVDTGFTISGERVVVASTELHADGAATPAASGASDTSGESGGASSSERSYGPLTAVTPLDEPGEGSAGPGEGRHEQPAEGDDQPVGGAGWSGARPWPGAGPDGGHAPGPVGATLPRRDAQATLTHLQAGGSNVFADPVRFPLS